MLLEETFADILNEERSQAPASSGWRFLHFQWQLVTKNLIYLCRKFTSLPHLFATIHSYMWREKEYVDPMNILFQKTMQPQVETHWE